MRKLLYLSIVILFFSSCGWLNPSIMLKTGKGYQYSKNPDSTRVLDYKISPNDVLTFNIYTNDGFKLIDLTSLNSSSAGLRVNLDLPYLVESDGNIKLPILGWKKISGYTIREAELMLEEAYSAFYIKPFVELNVTNRRVIVFPGASGAAKVVPLVNKNTTLLEAIALAGGIAEDGKSRMVKLIRQNNGKSDVYLIDLSSIKGINDGEMVIQAGDIIYVEPRRKYGSKFLQEIAPIVSIVSSTFLLYTYSKALKIN